MSMSAGWAGRARTNLLLAVAALGCAVAAFVLARHYLGAQAQLLEQQFAQRLQTRPVLVAARALAAGELASEGGLARRDMPVSFLRSDALDPQSASRVVGRRLLRATAAGDALTDADFAPRGAAALAATVPAGLRALTIAVDEVAGQSGLLRAGDKVDLYWQQQRADGPAQIALLLQAVPVLATGHQLSGQTTNSTGGDYGTLTLQLNPDDAARVLLAQRSGSLAVLLRGGGDVQATLLQVRDSRQLLQPTATGRHTQPAQLPMQLIVGGSGAVVAPIQNLHVSSVSTSTGVLP
jgi:pilus assembly protein CpaB